MTYCSKMKLLDTGGVLLRHTPVFLSFWSDLTRCGPMIYNNYYLSLHKKSTNYQNNGQHPHIRQALSIRILYHGWCIG